MAVGFFRAAMLFCANFISFGIEYHSFFTYVTKQGEIWNIIICVTSKNSLSLHREK